MEKNIESIIVDLHAFEGNGNCVADITLPWSGRIITGFSVIGMPKGGVKVCMPSWMNGTWKCVDIKWKEAKASIIKRYEETIGIKLQENKEDSSSMPLFSFYKEKNKKESLVDVKLLSGTIFSDIYFSQTLDENEYINICMPRSINNNWENDEIEWEQLVSVIKEEYFRQFLKSDLSEHAEITVDFKGFRNVLSCLLDISFPHKLNVVVGFKVTKIGDDIFVNPPKWMDRWADSHYPWHVLEQLIKNAFNKEYCTNSSVTHKESSDSKANEVIVRNHMGRVENAEKSAFSFYPQTVLRLEESKSNKKRLLDLVVALSKGDLSHFEISIVFWIAKLRYVTNPMLLDLISSGYISAEWKNDITAKKLNNILERLRNYDLIEATRFVSVDDAGNQLNGKTSVFKIYTLGRSGGEMLRALDKKSARYDPFDVYQDGNTVKMILSANQWLIYFLKTYGYKVLDKYDVCNIIRQRGFQSLAAKIYARITLDDVIMIAQPIRRVEDFETLSNNEWLKEKLVRMTSMFNHLDQLYKGNEKITFLHRPTIVIICEDDLHITEIINFLSEVIQENLQQTFWFTTDLRIFNKSYEGQRFITIENGEQKIVDENF